MRKLLVGFFCLISSINAVFIRKPLTTLHSPKSDLISSLRGHGGSRVPTHPPQSLPKNLNQINPDNSGMVITISAALSSLLQGYDTGVVGGALLYIIPEFQLSQKPLTQGLVVTMSTIGAVLGTIMASNWADSIGRRGTMRLSSVIFVAASLLLVWSPVVQVLVFARLLMGIAIGASSSVVPVYIAECAESSRRGALATIPQLFVSSGIMLALTLSFLFTMKEATSSWRIMMGVSLIPALIQASCAFFLLPESPIWLLRHRNNESALRALKRLRGVSGDVVSSSVQSEFHSMQLAHESDQKKETNQSNGWAALLEPEIRGMLFVCIFLQIFQQLSGINAVVYYTPHTLKLAGVPRLFRRFGIPQNSAAILASALAYAPKIPTLLVAMRLMDSLGRRALLQLFIPCMAVCLFSLAGVFSHLNGQQPVSLDSSGGSPPSWIPPTIALAGLSLYGVFFSLSLGPIPNIISSELFPARCRSAAMTCSLASQYIFNTLVGFAFPILVQQFGSEVVFGGFGVMCVCAFIFVQKFVHETSGSELN